MKTLFLILVISVSLACSNKKHEEKKLLINDITKKNDKLNYEVKVVDGLSIPNWLKGGWQNVNESNTNNFVLYSFTNNSFKIRHGLNFNGNEKFVKPFLGYSKKESFTDSTYFVDLIKNNNKTRYEFKLHDLDWSEGEKVLTYSIIEDGEVKREHFTSCQLILKKVT